MYMNGEFIVIYYLENQMQFNKGSYQLKDGVVTETIESSSTETLIGESYTYMPNFMGDKNSSDPRNLLFDSYLRLVKNLNPKCILMENVVGFKTMYQGRFLENTLKCFEENNNISLVLEKKNIIVGAKALDITENIMILLNKETENNNLLKKN